MAKKQALGKGLNILIPTNNNTPTESAIQEITELKIKTSLISPRKDQPRSYFNEDKLQELADSIKQHGIIEPLLVVKKGEYYELIAGERRWRAAVMIHLQEVPVKVLENLTEREILELSLIENIQRENLNAIEEARAYQRLLNEFDMTQDQMAERVSKSRTAVTNSMRLLKLSGRVQDMIIEEMITGGHGRALLSITDEEEQFKIAQRVFDEKMSVRQVETLVRNIVNKKEKEKKEDKEKKEREYQYQQMAGKIREALGRKVTISGNEKGTGKIEIEFYDNQDFDELAIKLLTLKEGN